MSNGTARDVARQVLTVVGAVFQVVAPVIGFVGEDVGATSDANRSLIVPAGYAFAIWSLIFLLCLAYAVYQALPGHRTDALLRSVGWWAAAAFLANGVWELLFPAQQFALAQLLIVAIFAFAALAQAGVVRAARSRPLRRGEAWLVALPIGLLFGWITAATLVGFATTLVATGVWSSTGTVEAVVGALLLLAGAAIAAVVLRASRPAPAGNRIAYGGAVIWALVAVVVNQADDSVLTSGAAVLSALIVAAALATSLTGPRQRTPATPRVA
jgi:hypothetical protein